MITGIYAALLALMQTVLTLEVVKIRRGQKISLGDGGEEALTRRMRAHGNFIETVPMALLLILIAEFSGANLLLVHGLGALLLTGRIFHAIGLTTGTGHGKFRVYGMVLTLSVYAIGSLLCIWLALPILI